ncbi:hypothetical protein [uncultured Psychrosphaera sp.]|uniref:hypothetical protein n=1 Tax=uncultured Psychrosphaera sp. TaxID=1403522 RepID=UPI0026132E29|nr:hypothetical protein [uncultured Psychrosphaera sp.]
MITIGKLTIYMENPITLLLNKILNKSVVIFALFWVCNINASTLRVSQHGDEIHILLLNESYSLTKVNYNFCLSSVGDLNLLISNLKGISIPLESHINAKCKFENKSVLDFNEFKGKVFFKNAIELYYDLQNEDGYFLSAELCENKPKGKINCISSNKIEVKK